jgi:hypothetical protein
MKYENSRTVKEETQTNTNDTKDVGGLKNDNGTEF